MNKLLSNPLNDGEIAKLRRLLGREVMDLYAPSLTVDLSTGLISAHQISFWLHGRSSQFLNISTDWWQTELDDYHTFVLETSATPADIPFDASGKNVIGPTSNCACRVGRVQKIEIVQSKFEVIDGPDPADMNNSDPAAAPPVKETIVYDRGINFICERGIISLATEFGPILGDIQIRNGPVTVSGDESEVMKVRKTLT